MKGGLQVSVGFLIIMVVSALVLIFIMGWLGALFPQLTRIGEYATAQAEQQMMNEFAKGTDVILATIPYKEQFSPGSEVHFKIGVKKTEVVDEYEFFSLCVGTMESTICKTPSELTPIVVGQSGIEFKFTPVTKIITRGDIRLLTAIMTIPQDTPPGIYGFKVYVCPGNTEMQSCTGLRNSYGEFDFIVEVK
jgi:hypothetical protein